MSAVDALQDQIVGARAEEAAEFDALRAWIDAVSSDGAAARLIGPDDEPIVLPASAFAALRLVVHSLAEGRTMTLVPHGKDLTTQEVADILHVSRPHVIKLLDRGDMPFERTSGGHRRVRIEDVLEFRSARAMKRREHLRRLTELSQETGIES